MPTDPTQYHPLEPTVPAFDPYALSNPYEVTEPYHSGLPLVPPPPKQRHTLLIILWLVTVLLGSAIGTGVLFSFFARTPLTRAPSPTLVHQSTKPIPVTLTPTITHSTTETQPTQQPTLDPNYTAVDIMNDFNTADIHPSFTEYNRTIWSWTGDTYFISVHATSSVNFTDDSACTSPCGPANLGVWVYASKSIAQQAYSEVRNDANQVQQTSAAGGGQITPTVEYTYGRCLLLGSDQDSIYGQVITRYCIS